MDSSFFQEILNFFSHIRLVEVIDIILVLYLLYELYNLLKGTSAISIFFGIIAIYLLWKLVSFLELKFLSEILRQFISVGVIALIIVFQQEIRKFLLLLGNPKFIKKNRKRFLFWSFHIAQETKLDIDIIAKATGQLSASKTGALIVLTRKSELENIISTGTPVDALISESLIENIFFKNSPLHDGAIVISDNRIAAAKCILPISQNESIPNNIGIRHRAGVGVTENSDAIVIIVSEQTGEIALSVDGKLNLDISINEIKEVLENSIMHKK